MFFEEPSTATRDHSKLPPDTSRFETGRCTTPGIPHICAFLAASIAVVDNSPDGFNGIKRDIIVIIENLD